MRCSWLRKYCTSQRDRLAGCRRDPPLTQAEFPLPRFVTRAATAAMVVRTLHADAPEQAREGFLAIVHVLRAAAATASTATTLVPFFSLLVDRLLDQRGSTLFNRSRNSNSPGPL